MTMPAMLPTQGIVWRCWRCRLHGRDVQGEELGQPALCVLHEPPAHGIAIHAQQHGHVAAKAGCHRISYRIRATEGMPGARLTVRYRGVGSAQWTEVSTYTSNFLDLGLGGAFQLVGPSVISFLATFAANDSSSTFLVGDVSLVQLPPGVACTGAQRVE